MSIDPNTVRAAADAVQWAWNIDDARMIAIKSEHPACTCHMCRWYTRRYSGPTLQERRATLQANES